MKPKVYLRTDGNSEIGLGHITRSIALSQMLSDFFECVFIIKNPDDQVEDIVTATGCKLLELTDVSTKKFVSFIEEEDLVVLDGYHFDTSYQNSLKVTGCKLVCIDDIHAVHFVSDAVINHCGGINQSHYSLSKDTALFTGPEYAILRKQFYEANKQDTGPEQTKNVFINLGGADPLNITQKVLHEIKAFEKYFDKIHVVVGAAYQHYHMLKKNISEMPSINLHKNLSADKLIDLMQKCDIAICSASTIAYEYCSVNGMLFIIQTADNQKYIAEYLISSGMALPYSAFASTVNSSNFFVLKQNLVNNQQKVFDGKAHARILNVFKKIYLKDNIIIRKAGLEDIDTYFAWANDKEVRQNSFNTNPVTYKSHCNWFTSKLKDPNYFFYTFTSRNNIPVANVRFEIKDDEAIVSYLIDKDFRKLGLGSKILKQSACTLFTDCMIITKIKGYVKSINLPSVRAFLSAGYQELEAESNDNIKCFIIKKEKYE